MGHHTQYIVSLSQEEKNKLQAMSKDNKLSARVSKRVLILLALDDKKNSNLNHCFRIKHNGNNHCSNCTRLFSKWTGTCHFPSL